MQIRTFIDRPILSGVIAVLMVLFGLIALANLALEQFPEIAPPTVRINANYTGANAETVQKSVVVPLEEAINGVEGMMYMSSTASNTGSASISVFFRQGTDPDMAMVNVQNRAATVQGRLPADVVKGGLTVRKRQTSNIKQLTVYSADGTFDRTFLANYTKINIEPRLSRIAGVGDVNVIGADYSMRIWLDPQKMANYGITPADINKVLDEQNVEAATGTLGADSENTFQYVLKYRGRYEEEQGYEQIRDAAQFEAARLQPFRGCERIDLILKMIPLFVHYFIDRDLAVVGERIRLPVQDEYRLVKPDQEVDLAVQGSIPVRWQINQTILFGHDELHLRKTILLRDVLEEELLRLADLDRRL